MYLLLFEEIYMLISKQLLCEIAQIKTTTLWSKIQKLKNKEELHNQYLPIESAREILTEYYKKKNLPVKKIQTFFNFKGGTGKTSMTYNLSYFFHLLGYKILVIDCDPQAHLTRTLLGDDGQSKLSIYELIDTTSSFNRVVKEIHPDFHFIPSSVKLSFVDSLISLSPIRETVIAKLLQPIEKDYDFIFIDVNPAIGVLNRNIIVASDILNIVCEASPYSFYGMETLLQEFNLLEEVSKNKSVEYNVILNKMEPKTRTQIEILSALQQHVELSSKLCDEIVKKSEVFNISVKESTPVLFLKGKKNINSKYDIINLGKELLKKTTKPVDQKGEVKDAA